MIIAYQNSKVNPIDSDFEPFCTLSLGLALMIARYQLKCMDLLLLSGKFTESRKSLQFDFQTKIILTSIVKRGPYTLTTNAVNPF
jgi:hypothetical protein